MSDITKLALAESLKKLLLKKSLTRITINDLTTDCGISREQIENFLFQLTHDLIMAVVEEQSKATILTEKQKNFIADFTNTVLSGSCSTGSARE